MNCPHCQTKLEGLPDKCPFCTGDIAYEKQSFGNLLLKSILICGVGSLVWLFFAISNGSMTAMEMIKTMLQLTFIGGPILAVFLFINPSARKK